MKKWSKGASNLASVFFVIIIVHAPITLSRSIVENDKSRNYLPDKWKVASPALQPPQIDIKLLKGHVSDDENLFSSVEYVFSNNDDNNQVPEMIPEVGDRNTGNEFNKGAKEISFGPKTIFVIPTFGCPSGQRRDKMGNCREIL